MNAKDSQHSFIHNIHIASPCNVPWETMTGDERSRYCHSCRLNVYNIAEMTTKEAEELILEKEGKLCLRIYRRADGRVITKDCPRGVKIIRDRILRTAAGAFGIVALCAAWVAARLPQDSPAQETILKLEADASKHCQKYYDSTFSSPAQGGAPSFDMQGYSSGQPPVFSNNAPTAGLPAMPPEMESHKALNKLEKLKKL